MFRRQAKASVQPKTPLAHQAADTPALSVFEPEIVNSFRHMVTSLVCGKGFPERLAVVAALRGEGVTYTALALATILAHDTAARVCAVELNWWAPGMQTQLHHETGIAHKPSLADVVLGSATLDQALMESELPNLALLPAGNVPVEKRPILARSAVLKSVIEELSTRFDHLVLDIPAIGATSDAIALASLGTACCIVVRQGLTPTNIVQAALDDIAHLPMLGVVMNHVAFQTPRWLHGLVPQE